MKLSTGIALRACSVVFLSTFSALAQRSAVKPPSDDDKQLSLRGQLGRDPHDREAHNQLVALLRKNYAFRTELEEDAVWLKNNPDDYSAEISMRSLATTINDPEFAINIDRYILAHAKREDYPAGYDTGGDRLAFLLIGRGQYPEALVLLKRATQLSPSDPGVWENLGDGQVKAGQYSEAVSSYKKSLDLDGNQELTHEGLALAYFNLKDYLGSAIELQASISVYNAQYHGGAPTDSWHQAIKNINKMTKSDLALCNLHLMLAKTLLAHKKFDPALAEVETASHLDDNFSPYYLRAEIYDAMGQLEKASAARESARLAVEKLLKSQPPSKDEFSRALSLPQEVFVMTLSGEIVDTAHELIVLLEPLNKTLKPLDRQFLGMAYCEKKRLTECEEQMTVVLQSNDKWNNAVTQNGYAKALVENNDSADAIEHFARAYELEPQNATYRADYEAAKTP